MKFLRKIKDSRDPGGGEARRGLAEYEPRGDLSMGRKITEIPKEKDGFWKSRGLADSANSQKFEPRVDLSMGRKIIEIP